MGVQIGELHIGHDVGVPNIIHTAKTIKQKFLGVPRISLDKSIIV
jgi:hypothetical protein